MNPGEKTVTLDGLALVNIARGCQQGDKMQSKPDIKRLAYFKWEFCRRDPSYIEIWNKILKIRKRAEFPYGTIVKGPSGIKYDKYLETDEYEQEKMLLSDYGLIEALNPDNSCDELLNTGREDEERKNRKAISHILGSSVQQMIRAEDFYYCSWRDALSVILKIDFRYVANKRQLLEKISKIADDYLFVVDMINNCNNIDECFSYINNNRPLWLEDGAITSHDMLFDILIYITDEKIIADRRAINERHGSTDYENILKAGDLYYVRDGMEYNVRHGMTHLEVAKSIFPNDFQTNHSGNPVSKNNRVWQLCGLYLKLVQGGWRTIGVRSGLGAPPTCWENKVGP